MFEKTYLDPMTPEEGAELIFSDVNYAAALYQAIADGELRASLVGKQLFTSVRDINVWRGAPTGFLGVKGTIYVVGFGPYVKIGFTRGSVKKRVASILVSCPEPLATYATIQGTVRTERELHERFRHLKLRGEWFKKQNDLLVWIDRGCKLQ